MDRKDDRPERLGEFDDILSEVSMADRPIKRMRRSARNSMIGSWVFGVLGFLGVVGVIAPETPDTVPTGVAIAVVSTTLSVVLGIRSHRSRRSSEEIIRSLVEGDGQPDEPRAGSAPAVDATSSDAMIRLDSDTRELAPLIPELARVLPDVALVARSAEVTLTRLGRRLVALEIGLRSDTRGPATHSTTRQAELLRADHERTSQSLAAGLDAYRKFVQTAAVVVAGLPDNGSSPVDDLHRASEELEYLAVGLAEVSRINQPYLGTGA